MPRTSIDTSTRTSWEVEQKQYPALMSSLDVDAVIIGGGITGVLTAYLLTKAGKSVVLLEQGEIGGGASHFTTACITESLDTDFSDLVKAFPLEDARQLLADQGKAIKTIERIIREEHIDCDWKKIASATYATTKGEFESLKDEVEAARQLGVTASLHKPTAKFGFKNAGYMELPGQAVFHPLKFITALASIVEEEGALIFEESKADSIEQENGRAIVHACGYRVSAPWVISATYEPFNEPLRLYFEKGLYWSYVFELFVSGIPLREGVYEDTANPYHYARIEKEGRGGYRVIVGGEDHRQDLPVNETKSFNALQRYVETLFPRSRYLIRRKWRGPILEPIDGIPLIGPMNDDPILYASAFSGTGMTYAVVAAEILRDYVLGKPDKRRALYSAKRIMHLPLFLRKARDYAGEIAGAAIKNTFKERDEPEL